MKKTIGYLVGCMLWAGLAQAAFEPFKVQDIRLEGIQRIEPGVVFRQFPLATGDLVTQSSVSSAVKKLFQSGYFEDIQVEKQGDILLLKVVERPAVSLIRIEGSKAIKEEDLRSGLEQSGLREGDVFKRSALDRIRLDLQRLYVAQGRYGAQIDVEVEPLAGNRVALNIDINEGETATIQHINIVGNTLFPDEDLKELFTLKLPSFWSFFTKDDRYAREKLSGDLERLRSYYLDRGYLEFNIDSTQVSITPDRKHVFITVNVTEGDKFTVKDLGLAGDLVIDRETLSEGFVLKPGDVFSRKLMNRGQDNITRKLGDQGYLFAKVTPVPEVDGDQVAIKYIVDPGQQTYVRRITIKGNHRTSDVVVRREFQQMEAALASTEKIEHSKTRIERTGFFKNVEINTQPVPGTSDQVDVHVEVEEQTSGQFTASVGFSQSEGLILDLGVEQENFLGSGNKVGFGIAKSRIKKEASFSFVDPYYTVDGVSRGFDIFYRERDFSENDASKYDLDEYGGSLSFGYPIDDTQRLSFSIGYERIKINANANEAPVEIDNYIADNGDSFDNFKGTIGWSDNTLNKGVFPTDGYRQWANLEVALPGSDLSYYRANYGVNWYRPIDEDNRWVVGLRGRLGYADALGDKEYPFFKNFFAGGIRTLRGFQNNSLGPQDSNGDSLGGNVMVTSGADLIFPIPFVEDGSSFRALMFFDAGNVYATSCLRGNANSRCEEGIDLGDLRYSAGVGVTWLSPLGPLSLSLGKPLNSKPGDDEETLQFALGQSF